MARKSKDAILRERLLSVSECPFDIFDFTGEEALPALERCESGDIPSIENICSTLYASLPDGTACNAIVYLLGKGVAHGSRPCAALAVAYIAARELIPELAVASLALLGEGEPTYEMRRVVAMLAIRESENYRERLALLPEEEYAGVWLFVLRREGALSDTEARRLAVLAGVPQLPAILSGADISCGSQVELARLCEWLFQYPDEGWRDFWLGRAYEYACALGDGICRIAPMLLDVFRSRTYCERSPLYALAVARYMATRDAEYAAMTDKLEATCGFIGLDSSEMNCEALIREGIYTDSRRERELYEQRERLGGIIEHTKNRYSLTHELVGRDKRAKMHHWETVISIEAEQAPRFVPITLEEVRHRATRGGVVLERDPTSCQIICRSELLIGERRHPFELDLCVDVSFISATKCQRAELHTTEVEQNGKYLTMRCDFYLK